MGPKQIKGTYPEDTYGVPGTVRRTIRLDHTEHAMELPADEENDEEVMSIPEALEVVTSPFFRGEVDHDGKADGHNPPGSTGPGGEVGLKESEELCATCLCGSVSERELGKVDHVRSDMHGSAEDDRPGGGLMKGDVLVKGDDLVEGCATKEGDEIATDGEKDEDDINM